MKNQLPRIIAFYLPQFHPIQENDKFWGRGFTEWTNTAKAKKYFPGHYQPHVPADLGFYDLRLPASRLAQAELAKQYKVDGFCYYHYWFGNGRQVLEKPLDEVVLSGEPNYPFCICWANETWSGVWHGAENMTLIEQNYPGLSDHAAHFDSLLSKFKDDRYMKIDGKPIMVIYRPLNLPTPLETIALWRKMAFQAGLPGLFFIGMHNPANPIQPEDIGFDASIYDSNVKLRDWGSWKNPVKLFKNYFFRKAGIPTIKSFKLAIKKILPEALALSRYPSVIHAWDNTPRSGVRGLVLTGSSPANFSQALKKAFDLTRNKPYPEGARLIFLKSWNEWAEGNHLEPDLKYGHAYLAALRDAVLAEHELTEIDNCKSSL